MDEFDAKLAQYVRRAQAGEEVHITRWGRPVATLGPPASAPRLPNGSLVAA
ncbi:MAG TPA: type II toxin-antitoxin system prevent-host-death family antitoxin [Solirubrobacterales bacterium]